MKATGFWITIEETSFGYVHIPADKVAEVLCELLEVEDNGYNKYVTIHPDAFD